MGLFSRKKNEKEAKAERKEKVEETQQEQSKKREPAKEAQQRQSGKKEYIKGAGGTIVSKSILEGTSKLKWLFRQEGGHGNGWIAFGDADTQEYVDNPDNMTIVDFNELANIEPAVVNVFFLPVGADLEFCDDKTGKYFVDTRTGEEIRGQVPHPLQAAFEKNLKFLNKESYPEEFFRELFTPDHRRENFVVGEADFPTGEIVLADPLVYLGTEYMVTLERRIPAGSYPVELAVCHSEIAGTRIVGARLIISGEEAVRHEIAMPKGSEIGSMGEPGVWAFFGVDGGMACFSDTEAAEKYRSFSKDWQSKNPGKNPYLDYFAPLFQESSEKYPQVQREGGDFLQWQIPGTDCRLVMFTSGMGDGIYSGYWGMDAKGEAAELVIPFINPAYI